MHYLKREGLLKADGAAYTDDAFAEGVVCPADWNGIAGGNVIEVNVRQVGDHLHRTSASVSEGV